MSLLSLVDHTKTDKQSRHHYLSVYEKLLSSREIHSILEIGIDRGGSIELWRKAYPTAEITGIELQADTLQLQGENLYLYYETDAYDLQFCSHLQETFDLIIDDGSHKLQDMKTVLQIYSQYLSKTGLLILEDISNDSWRQELLSSTPLDCSGEFIDNRGISGVYDSVLYVVQKK